MRLPISLHLHHHLLLPILSIKAILEGVKWYLIVILIFSSLMANHIISSFAYWPFFLKIYFLLAYKVI